MHTKSAVCSVLLSLTISLIFFNISFSLFRRQRKKLVSEPQCFFRDTHARFLHLDNEWTYRIWYRIGNCFSLINRRRTFSVIRSCQKTSRTSQGCRLLHQLHIQGTCPFFPMLPIRTRHSMFDHSKTTHFRLFSLFIIYFNLPPPSAGLLKSKNDSIFAVAPSLLVSQHSGLPKISDGSSWKNRPERWLVPLLFCSSSHPPGHHIHLNFYLASTQKHHSLQYALCRDEKNAALPHEADGSKKRRHKLWR